ncbi:MAG: HSP20 family protein [bacterium]|jgi:HSP20 family protein
MFFSNLSFDQINKDFDTFMNNPFLKQESKVYPKVNIYDNEKESLVLLPIPGIEVGEISLKLHDSILTITGSVKKEVKEGEKYVREERSSKEFTRKIEIPFQVDEESIQANLKEGLLEVRLLRSEKEQPKEIPVTQV